MFSFERSRVPRLEVLKGGKNQKEATFLSRQHKADWEKAEAAANVAPFLRALRAFQDFQDLQDPMDHL